MAFDANVRRLPGAVAGADFSTTGKYRFGVIGAGIAITVNNSNGARVAGVILDNPASGHSVEFGLGDVLPVEAGAAVADGALIQSDGSGRAITQASTGCVCGYALEAAATAGDVIPVLFQPQGAP
jgi:hypothetical protein